MRKALFLTVTTLATLAPLSHAQTGVASKITPALLAIGMPEPSGWLILAVDFAAIAVVGFFLRRRLSRGNNRP